MCGIAGSVGGEAPTEALLLAMAASMERRGPDDQGTWADAHCGLAFRRLAIIDLDPRSSQPMHREHLHLVFNGEIYNYRELRAELGGRGRTFTTEGDGEVLLQAWAEWGEGALDRLNGMFAFAIWDERERQLTLASDPFGEKPLYWARAGDRLVFGSEVGALLLAGVEARADEGALAAFVAANVPPPIDASYFAGVQRLPGAHLLRWRDGTVAVERWWRPREVPVPGRYGDAVDALRELLVDSVRLRMRSDVPLGTSLSGGVDSSAVAALVGRLGSNDGRHAFTARFPGYERDEWSYAATAAAAAGVECHHAIEPTAADALCDLDALVRDEEEPVASLSVYAQWRVNAAAKEAGVTVLLDGQGGDELFGGYPFATGFALRAASPRAQAAALADAPLAATAAVARSLGADHLPAALRRRYQRRLASPYAAPADVAPPRLEPWMQAGGPLRRELVAESFVTSLPQLLRYADRSSMAHSREVRLPLLDRRVAELALSLPADYLRPRGVAKGILRDSVADLVPRELLARRDKVGFEPPQQRWLETTAFRDRIGEVLLDPRARARGLYESGAIEADLRAQRWRAPAAIWRALNAELWLTGLVEDRPSVSPSPAAGSPTRI